MNIIDQIEKENLKGEILKNMEEVLKSNKVSSKGLILQWVALPLLLMSNK